MKISRSTRNGLIIILTAILILLICILCYLIINDKEMTTNYYVNLDKLATGTNEIKKIDNPFYEMEEISSNDKKEEEVIEIETQINDTPKIVYDNMTLEELASKLDKSLNDDLSGKGNLYASYCLEKGVDPYLAVAISLEETGCTWTCSSLVKTCNNVGGMKGTGCGEYGYFSDLDNGIKAFIDNIANNYVAYGLTTADLMNPKYAENPNWSYNVNNYIEKIKNK